MIAQSLTTILGYFLAIVLVPFEVTKLIIQVEDQIQKKNAWYVIAGTLFAGIITLLYYAGNTAVEWGSTSAFATGAVALSAPVFTAMFGLLVSSV